MARSKDPCALRSTCVYRVVSTTGEADYDRFNSGLRERADRPLGVHVLVSARSPEPAGGHRLDRGGQEPARYVWARAGDGRVDLWQLRGRGNCRAKWLPTSGGVDVPGLFRRDVSRVPRTARPSKHPRLAARHWPLPGRIRPFYDVLAAAVSDALAHDGRRFLLQHRPACSGVWHRVLRHVWTGRQLPDGTLLRKLSVFTGRGVCAHVAGAATRE